MSLIDELKRRNVFRVGAAYAIVACLAALFLLGSLLSVSCTAPEEEAPRPERGFLFEEVKIPIAEGFNLYGRVVGEGPEMVLVPAGMYLAQDLSSLAEGRTLVFYDLRARGGSDYVIPQDQLGIDFDVSDMDAVRAFLGVDRVSLIGWSYLGAVVALYAAEYPEHVSHVVQIGPMEPRPVEGVAVGERGSSPDPSNLQRLADLRQTGVQELDPVRYCREWLKLELLPSVMGRPEAVSETKMDPCIFRNEWPDRVFETLGKVVPQAWDYSEQAATVRASVLVLHGTADPSAPIEGGRDWLALIPNARLVEMEGVGHLPWLEDSPRFFSEVDAFLPRGE
jgi:pimeloyl-ACP methyl ester carboxylesterase